MYDLPHMASTDVTETPKSTRAAYEAWSAIFELFGRYKPTMLAIQGEYGLRPPMVFAMKELDEPKPMGRIAEVLHCDNSQMTWITDRLEEKGLVERTADPGDRRVKLLVLTDEGRRVRDEIDERLAVPPPEIAALSAADARALRDLLRQALAGAG
jgi:MarR family transcriptional regulator, organic hydroperoxide resistance regulator